MEIGRLAVKTKLISLTNWPKKLIALGLFLVGAGLIAFASYYFIVPRIADHRLNSELEQARKVDKSRLIPEQVRSGGTAASSDVSPASSSIPLGDKLTFRYVNWKDVPSSTDELGVRIVIPTIELDEEVVELKIYEKDGVMNYETPKFAVGHLIDQDNIGSNRDVFLWGHIESPWIHEGKPFKRLSETATYLAEGKAVDVFVYTKKHVYVYRIVDAKTSSPEDVGLGKNSGEPTLNLVSSWPPRGYWNRFIATAKLVQVADIPPDMQDPTVLKSLPSAYRANGLLG